MSASLQDLLREGRVWRGRSARSLQGRRTGFSGLDRLLPERGWPARGLIEIICSQPGIGELSLLLPSLREQAQTWIAPPYLPYAPALSQQGVDLRRLLLIEPQDASQALWATEQVLRYAGDAAVLSWHALLRNADLRRLQLAAENGGCQAFVFRPRQALQQASPACLRMYLSPAEQGLDLRVVKCRGGHAGSVLLPLSSYEQTLAVPASAAIASGSAVSRVA